MRCLIVDDSRTFLTAARSLLEMEGIAVVAACTTAAEALMRVTEAPVDVAVVDVMLGSDSSVELAQQLRAVGCRVVMTSTHERADIEDLLSESLAVGFLPKTELCAETLRRTIDRPPPAAGG